MATKEPVLGEGAAAAAVADEDSSLDLGVDFSDSEGEERVADGEERRGRPALFVDSDASAGASIAGDYSYSDGELLDCSDFSDGQVSAPFLLSIRVFPSFPSLALTLPLFPAPLSLSLSRPRGPRPDYNARDNYRRHASRSARRGRRRRGIAQPPYLEYRSLGEG